MKRLYTLLLPLLFISAYSQTIGIQNFATGFTSPVEITHAKDSRLFVVEQGGTIKILNADGTTNSNTFLNIASLISTGGERGLLGLAFHPNYTTNGYFYINYTNVAGNTVIARYSVNSTNPNLADTNSALILLTISQPFTNHKGGSIKFGPDNFLYIGMGDGGSGGDPGNRAQNKNELLGKMLRIDVNNGSPYGIPSNNPFVGVDGSDEVWAIGLRNPWKFSFDSNNGDLWIADVGQDNFEEINKASAQQSGLNYGWRCYEGNANYNTSGCAPQTTMTAPLAVVNHNTGSCSITGGYVYNGTKYPNLIGKYLFTDYCNPKIGMVTNTGTVTYSADFLNNNFVTFGEDFSKELYIAAINNGTIYKITDTTLGNNEDDNNNYAVFPNPARSEINIQMSNGNYPVNVSIYDAGGKLLLKQKTEKQMINTINISNLSTGFYVMRIINNADIIATHKLIVH